jgi:hypothetical protein
MGMHFAEIDGLAGPIDRMDDVPFADVRLMTTAQFRRLGMPSWVYLRCSVVTGQAACAVYAADGTEMAIVEDAEVAIEFATAYDMTLVAVH